MAKATSREKTKQDIISVLESEHRYIEQLFDALENVKDTAKKSEQSFDELYKVLSLHAYGEELVFYPAMRDYEQTAEYVEEAEEEHNSVKILLEQMKQLSSKDKEFQVKLKHIKEMMMHHVEEEENEIFKVVRQCMDEKMLLLLAQEFEVTKTKMLPEVEEAIQ
ncbi:MAG TPA: hemerythrin domain-containing protein [Trichocoleus sp.]|jgi:hemerythrin superfamily protein